MSDKVSLTPHEIGRSLREMRARRGLSQEDVAQSAGVSVRTLRRIEAGDAVRSVTVAAVCHAVGWSSQEASSSPRFLRSRGAQVRYCLHVPEDTIWYTAMDSRKRHPKDDHERIQVAAERHRLGYLGLVGMFFGTLRFTLPDGPGIAFFEIYRNLPIGGDQATYRGLFLYCLRGEIVVAFDDEAVPLSAGAAIDVGDERIEIRPARTVGRDDEAPLVMHVGYGWLQGSPIP